MAIAVETHVRNASQEEHDALADRVDEAIGSLGGPPAGLMAHFARPDGDGFVVVDVWRTESEMREFYHAVFSAALQAAGLEADPPSVSPVWGFARP